ncbi:MAG: aminopeptidase P family protein [Cytophagales bacterium]|nr:aminopeptidase P family protein [Cytophagales bacterium]
MRYKPLSASFYQRNRARLLERLPKNCAVLITSNDIMPTNADGVMPFRQNNDLFYLTGIDQEETTLLLAPQFPDEDLREVLFLKKTNEHIKVWEGQKFTQKEGGELSGISKVKWSDTFESTLGTVLPHVEEIYVYRNEQDRSDSPVQTRNDKLIQVLKQNYPLHPLRRLAPAVNDLRTCKTTEEIDAIREACKITGAGFESVARQMKPGMHEYEIEAIWSYEFLRRGSRGFAYQPIVASGENSCVLHYVENDQVMQDGEVVLMDIGAEYGNYNADLTRVLPTNGRFTDRQKAVYEAVLRVKNEATKLLVPGGNLKDYQKSVGKLMESELIGLGLITKEEVAKQNEDSPIYRNYFMHGTSHHLGLDVHDVPSRYQDFKTGMVFTVEPGIYIPEENLGIRLEDDVVITEGTPQNLMHDIPIEVNDIEALMNA